MRRPLILSVIVLVLCIAPTAAFAEDSCVECHRELTPGQVTDWETSRHHEMGIGCSACHGNSHMSAEDVDKVSFPDETTCSMCHSTQFEQFTRGKHNHGWTSMNALPISHLEPDILIE